MTVSTAPDPATGLDLPSEGDNDWRGDARALIADLFQRSARFYWADFLASAAGAWVAAAVYFTAVHGSAVQIAALMVSAVLFFRVGTFIHEIVHMPSGQLVWFKRAWNLLVGVPLLMPWILYRNHIEHHNHHQFGTPDDGEYLPLASSPLRETAKYLLQAPLLPLFMIVRFGIIGPISWLHPALREWALTYVSAAVSNPYYRKRFPKRDQRHLLVVEIACFAWLALLVTLAATHHLSAGDLGRAYLLLAVTLSLNWVRNLAAHRYGNAGHRMTMREQVEDSINITGQTWLTVLMFPVGLRYHALHHMFPGLPYHAMGEAHRRLMAGLPADAPYRVTNRESYFGVVGELWRSARKTPKPESSMSAWSLRSSRS